jgi:hypothetical protein
MPDLTLTAAIEMQQELEAKIQNLINEFSATTGLHVERINLDRCLDNGERIDYLVDVVATL